MPNLSEISASADRDFYALPAFLLQYVVDKGEGRKSLPVPISGIVLLSRHCVPGGMKLEYR